MFIKKFIDEWFIKTSLMSDRNCYIYDVFTRFFYEFWFIEKKMLKFPFIIFHTTQVYIAKSSIDSFDHILHMKYVYVWLI